MFAARRSIAAVRGSVTSVLGVGVRTGSRGVEAVTPTACTPPCLPLHTPIRRMYRATPASSARAPNLDADDYYDVLGVDRDASKSAIKKQYYKLAKQHHPDQNSGDPEASKRFAKLQNAYEVLSDDQRRGSYDQFGADGVNMDGMPGGGMHIDPEELFSQLFGNKRGGGGGGFGGFGGGGGGRGRVAARRGADIQTELRLSFMDAVHGTKKDVHINANAKCNACDATGSTDKAAPVTCSTCGGSGQQTVQNGFFAMSTPCGKCMGEGVTVANPCSSCGGEGVRRETKTVEVKVPAGVDSGMNLRLSGQGDAGERGGPAGHMYVHVTVADDPFFKRKGSDVYVELPINVTQAILGDTVSIPTLKGEVDLRIPAGSQPNDRLKLRGRGIKRLNSSAHGNQFVDIKIRIPKVITDRQRELLEEFEEIRGEQPEEDDTKWTGFLSEAMHRIKRAIGAE